jgi:tetratricopeptide (TPR) repeat protein
LRAVEERRCRAQNEQVSGSGTFAGTTYQARVIAYVYVHVLAQARLGWVELFDDTPVGVSGETSGPGDDARLEFGERHDPIEVQAKHGLKAGAKLSEAIAQIRDRSGAEKPTDVIVVVDRGSSKTVHREFARDLERFRTGRTDGLRAEITRIAEELGGDRQLLQRLYVAAADLESPSEPDAKAMMHLLESVLEDCEQATAAWAVLTADAAEICAKKLRRTRKELVSLLTAAKINVRLPMKDERFMRQLDLSKRLLAEEKAATVLSVLGILDADLKGQDVDPAIRYRAAQHRAAALLQLGRSNESLHAARTALDFDSKGIHALRIAAHAAAETGDLQLAKIFADRALASDPNDPDVWAMRAQISAMCDTSPENPPGSIAETEAYQFSIAQVAANAGDWPKVEEITSALLARGLRHPRTLYLRITALANLSEGDESMEGAERRANAMRLADDAIDALARDAPLRAKLLVTRSELRRQAGDTAGSDEDIKRAIEINDTDPDAVAHLAIAQLHAGRADYALQTLRISAADEYPMLLVIRAQAFAETGDEHAARRDLDASISRADEAPQPDALRIFATETALALHDAGLAERYLNAISSRSFAAEMQSTLRGRTAFERGDADAMLEHFRAAATTAPAIKPKLFAELGQRLLRLGRTTDAVSVFDEIGLRELPPHAHREYAGALMEANDLPRAAKIVEEVGDPQTAPAWAVSIAADIAARQGDIARSVALLKILADRRPDDPRLLYELARRLVAMNQTEAAGEHLDRLVARTADLEPNERMAVAHLLKEASRFADAVPIAFSAFRLAQQDPAMHRGFASLLMTEDTVQTNFKGVVGDQTYVRLESDEDTEREYVIYADAPIDPVRNELSLEDAAKAQLVGRREGDTFVMNPDSWPKTRWTVKEVLPAIVYTVRDVVAHFEERFPAEPFFVHMMKMPDEDSVKFLAPIISSLHARKERALSILKLYQENILPLGFVAGMLGVRIPDVMQGASAVTEMGPLRVEWFDMEGQEESRSAAREATRVVLTRSAIETFAELGLLDVVANAYQWCVPQSLVESLNREVEEAEEKFKAGHRTMMASEHGLRFEEVPGGDYSLQVRVDRARTLATWVGKHTEVEYRPLATIERPGSGDEEARASIGGDSLDAVQLAEHFGITMLADDLGLRRMLPKGSRGRSFSTVSLVAALAEAGKMSAVEAEKLLLELARRNYAAILPTRALLIAAIQQERGATADLRRTFALLGGPILDLSSAARVAAETLKASLLLPLRLIDIAPLAQIVLDSLAARWPVGLCAHAFTKAAGAELALLPNEMKVVRESATAFVKRRA